MKSSLFVKSAVYLALGTFIVKLLGAVYRIPLVNLIGTEGLGLYQMVFPVYAILLDLSGAGIPSAISKLISSLPENDRKYRSILYLKKSIKLMGKVGFLGSLLMIGASYPTSILQGNKDAFWGYIALSPSVFFVSIISCYRGYFQGHMTMKPSAVSQVIESLIKLVVGLIVAKLLMPNLPLAVAGATFAVTVSEGIALVYLRLKFKKSVKGIDRSKILEISDEPDFRKKLIATSVPITLTGMAIPLSHFLDSFIIINLLPTSKVQATALYGILSGVVHTVLSLPVGVCYGIAVSSIPSISSIKDRVKREESLSKSLLITALVALPLAILTYFFAPIIVRILFSRLTSFEQVICIRLIRITSPCVLFLSLIQTSNALLVATDNYYSPLISLGVGIGVKTALSFVLIKNPQINIYGGGISLIACYFVAVMINFIVLIKKGRANADKTHSSWRCQAY